MFLRLNVSVDGGEDRDLVDAGRHRALEPGEVGHERRVADALAPGDAGKHLRGVGHLGHPLRADERRHLDDRKAAALSRLTNSILSVVEIRSAFVLKTVSRAHFDDCDPAPWCIQLSVANSTSTASACTSSPSRQCTATTTVVERADAAAPSSSLRE